MKLPHDEPLARFLARTTEALQADRQAWEPHWRELSDQFAPAAYFDGTDMHRGARKLHQFVFDSTSQIVVQRAVAGLLSHITPKARQWFRYQMPQRGGEKKVGQRSKLWLDDTSEQARRALHASNFYDVMPIIYEQAFVFGNGTMLVTPDPERVIHCTPLMAGSYWMALDNRGFPRTVLRSYRASVVQIVEEFGLSNVSEQIAHAYKKGELGGLHEVRHLIFPREHMSRTGPAGSSTAMPFASIYYEHSTVEQTGKLLREGGFRRMPVLSLPWSRYGTDTWARSPCMAALPFDRQLQAMTLVKGEAAAISAKPPVQAPVDMKNTRLDLEAGGVNYYDQSTQYGGVRPLIERPPDINPLREDVQDIRDQLRQALFVDLFLALQRIDQRMTAREVDARIREGLSMLGPLVHNADTHFLDPLLEVVYEILLEGGALLPFESEMAGKSFLPEYLGVLHQAQRATEMDGIERLLQVTQAVTVATNRPDASDRLDDDAIMDIAVESIGVTPRAVRSAEDVASLREQRAQMQAAQAAADAAQQQAMTARDAAAAPTDTANALTDGVVQGVA